MGRLGSTNLGSLSLCFYDCEHITRRVYTKKRNFAPSFCEIAMTEMYRYSAFEPNTSLTLNSNCRRLS